MRIHTLLFALLISACTPVSSPVATETPSLTATPTITPTPTETPTEVPTPTWDPTVQELPLSWWEEISTAAQKGDPNVSLVTAPCVNYDEELCVRQMDFCPEGTECVAFLQVSLRSSYNTHWTEQDWAFANPGVTVGPNMEYVTTMWVGLDIFETKTLFVTDEERETFICLNGFPLRERTEYLYETKMLFPVNGDVFNALHANGNGIFVVEGLNPHLSVADCDKR